MCSRADSAASDLFQCRPVKGVPERADNSMMNDLNNVTKDREDGERAETRQREELRMILHRGAPSEALLLVQ